MFHHNGMYQAWSGKHMLGNHSGLALPTAGQAPYGANTTCYVAAVSTTVCGCVFPHKMCFYFVVVLSRPQKKRATHASSFGGASFPVLPNKLRKRKRRHARGKAMIILWMDEIHFAPRNEHNARWYLQGNHRKPGFLKVAQDFVHPP